MALLALVLALSVQVSGNVAYASRVAPRPEHKLPTFSEPEAKQLLAEAKRQLRRDTKRVRAHKPVGDGPDTDITMTLRDLYLARTVLRGQDRREADAVLARPSDPGGDDVGGGPSVAYGGHQRYHHCPAGGPACVHWVETGIERITDTTDNDGIDDGDNVPDYVELVYRTVKTVHGHETGMAAPRLGYDEPLPDDGAPGDPNNPDQRIDIYLGELGDRGLYGYCAPEGDGTTSQVTGYCVLDNNYDPDEFNAPRVSSLRVTTAHEYFHAIQFGYDVGEDLWFMEGTATWVEDEVYDTINDNYQYLATSPIRYPRTSLDYTADLFPYGSFIFFTYASESGVGPVEVRDFWEAAVGAPTSLQAIWAESGGPEGSWPTYFATFGSWNTLPLQSYSERAGYPSYAWWRRTTLTAGSPSTGLQSIGIGHLGNAAMLVAPGSSLPTTKRLLVTVDGPVTTSGSAALLQRRFRNGTVSHVPIVLNSEGNGQALIQFNRTVLSSVVVVASNTNRYGAARTFKVRASLR